MGWILIAALLFVPGRSTLAADAGAVTPEPDARFLVIALDAVPFRSAARLTRGDEPLLADLAGPVPMVSTFPSSTSIALTTILARFGLEDPPGYEAKFFDREADKIRGGGLISYGRIRFDWHYFFDWQLRGFFSKSKVYARPFKYNVKELEKALAKFVESDERTFFVYVNSTDATGHIKGPGAFGLTFRTLDRLLPEVRRKLDVPLYVVIFSDHGLGTGDQILDNVRPEVKHAIRASGWKIRKHLRKPHSVVLTPFGLVSSFEIYTRPADAGEVARAAASAGGVDLCAYPQDGGWMVVDHHGEARIERRVEGTESQWAYRPLSADPLGYEPLVERLRPAPDDDWIDESVWSRETSEATYPDALYRIAQGFERVENPASILCSVGYGHLYGSKSAYLGARFSIGRIHWTHGALARDETLGFVMTDFPGWEATGARRFDHVLDFLPDRFADSGPSAEPTGTPPR